MADKPDATKEELFQLLESSVNRFLSGGVDVAKLVSGGRAGEERLMGSDV